MLLLWSLWIRAITFGAPFAVKESKLQNPKRNSPERKAMYKERIG